MCPACGAIDSWGGLVRWVGSGAAEAPCGRCDTRFTFVLDDHGWRVAGVGSAASLTGAAPRRVLVIEDDRLLSEALGVGLRQAGYTVQTASNGYTGLRLARERRPDLVLLDLQLPEVSGETVLAELQDDPNTTGIPVVVVSGKPERLGAAPEVAAVLRKPVALGTVLATVWQALNVTEALADAL